MRTPSRAESIEIEIQQNEDILEELYKLKKYEKIMKAHGILKDAKVLKLLYKVF